MKTWLRYDGQTTVELFCQNENGTYDTIEL